MKTVVAFLFIFASVTACAQKENTYVEGTHYRVLEIPVPRQVEDKIEVTEYFAYTCSHCFDFEGVSRDWKAKLPEDVAFIYTPAIWNETMELLARAYYTAHSLEALDKVHQALFNHIHINRQLPRSAEDIANVFAERGVDKQEVLKRFNSADITSKLKQADNRARVAKLDGTPTLVVNGKYVVLSGPEGHQGTLKVVDFLTQEIRAGAK